MILFCEECGEPYNMVAEGESGLCDQCDNVARRGGGPGGGSPPPLELLEHNLTAAELAAIPDAHDARSEALLAGEQAIVALEREELPGG